MNLKNCCVLVTPTSFGSGNPDMKTYLESQVGKVIYNPSGKPLNADALEDYIKEVDGYIAGLDEVNSRVIEKANKLKVIARYGVGLDNVDLKAVRKKGIQITNTPGANASAVADLTVVFILLLCRPICRADMLTKEGKWPRMAGYSLENKTIGLYGFGAIGQQVAKKISGFESRVIAYDLFPNMEIANKYHVEIVDREVIISESDFLSLHIPAGMKNRDFVNRRLINKMKDGAFLINTARGELIDEVALAEAIINKKLSGAALDAFNKEPPELSNPLLSMPEVITTPHMGAHAESATSRMGWMALEDCLAVLRGEDPKYPV